MKFLEVYRKNLERNMTENPTMYRKSFEETYKAMADGIRMNNFHIGTTIKQTCKEMGIKVTFKAISEQLRKERLIEKLEI
jgi:hypothetical protein